MAPQDPVRRAEFTRLEQRVGRPEDTVEPESGLRAMIGLDQARLTARLDAQDRLRAVSVTQSDHTARLTRLEAGQQRLEAGQQRLEDRSQELERVVGHVRDGIDTIRVRLGGAD